MKIYYEKDVIWEIEKAIYEAADNNQTIALIELDPIESHAFLEAVVALMGRGIVVRNFGNYLYKHVEIKLNSEFK